MVYMMLKDLASIEVTAQIGDSLYALIPPDANNQAIALVMYQPVNSPDPSTSDESTKLSRMCWNIITGSPRRTSFGI